MNTPGSLNCVAPRTRNSTANSVLPQPAAPHTSVGRPRGKPPSVTSSSPWIPVGVFARATRLDPACVRAFVIDYSPALDRQGTFYATIQRPQYGHGGTQRNTEKCFFLY